MPSPHSETQPTPVRLSSDDLQSGPWVFGRQVEPVYGVPDGALVEVEDYSGRFIGHALYNGASDIRLRWLARGKRSELARPREFLLGRLAAADRLRRKVLKLQQVTSAYRLSHAEGDDLPGLIVDRLGEWLVCEHHSLGFWQLRREVGWALGQLHPGVHVLHRFPRSAARAEGLAELAPERDELCQGDPERETSIEEHGLRFSVLPAGGHKTGWFCDQRDNRQRVAQLAAGRDVCDLFCNQGGFALASARAGARRVTAVDLDEVVLERAQRAAEDNRLDVECVHHDAFHFLRDLVAGGRYPGLIVVDPHKLIAGRTAMETGMRKYSDLNTLALQAVRSGGLVASFSCSGALQDSAFVGMLFAAARRADRRVRLIERYGAGPDHPQRPEFARSRYLKGALLAVD